MSSLAPSGTYAYRPATYHASEILLKHMKHAELQLPTLALPHLLLQHHMKYTCHASCEFSVR